ncbi:MAG: lipopolysaccharide biosynthesis protein, partial [Oceanihabitans sp.]
MGIVASQSIKNTIITYLGFGIGAINTLFLYTQFLTEEYYGLVGFVLSTANLMMPILMFGVGNSLIKFYASYKTRNQQNTFLSFMLVLPLLIILPLGLIGVFAYETIANWLASENAIIKNYTWHIYVIAIAMAYFEVFFSWAKVHLKSVFGNFMKEVFHRVCILFLLFAVYYNKIDPEQFIFALLIVYIARMLIIKIYAFSLRFPVIKFSKSFSYSTVLKYATLIIIAGSVSMLLLDLDKFMLGKIISIENIAYYNVAIFIATVIAVPARAMHQITHPLTAQLLVKKDKKALLSLYQKSSLNLLIIGGLIFVLVIVNIQQLYTFLKPEYSQGLFIVIVISIVKLIDNLLGNNNAILFNSNYYRIILVFGVIIVCVAAILNYLLIPIYKIKGAAIASFIALVLYSILKLWYVYIKFNMQPFTKNTLAVILL